jgi:hypothetical protein
MLTGEPITEENELHSFVLEKWKSNVLKRIPKKLLDQIFSLVRKKNSFSFVYFNQIS